MDPWCGVEIWGAVKWCGEVLKYEVRSLIFMRRYEESLRTGLSPGISLQYFIKWTSSRRSNSLNYRTHGHSTQVINIHEKK